MTILHETSHWLAVDKPAGLIVERNPFESPTVEEIVYEHLCRTRRQPYLGIVHRLDRVTSGVLLLAKKKSALKNLNEQFRLRQVQKTYLAMVGSSPPEKEGELVHWLEKDQRNKRAIAHQHPADNSQECRLHYRLLAFADDRYLLEIHPATGKFHQIRAQLAACGCPILGDEKYGSPVPFSSGSIALHAWKLHFLDPQTGNPVELAAPPPEGYAPMG